MAKAQKPKPAQGEKGRFLPGNNGGPGRPKGSRNKFGEQFISDVYCEWQKNGASAIEHMRRTDPSGFVRLVASIVPKDLPAKENTLADWSDDELDEAIRTLREKKA
jgi:hypothetical protein